MPRRVLLFLERVALEMKTMAETVEILCQLAPHLRAKLEAACQKVAEHMEELKVAGVIREDSRSTQSSDFVVNEIELAMAELWDPLVASLVAPHLRPRYMMEYAISCLRISSMMEAKAHLQVPHVCDEGRMPEVESVHGSDVSIMRGEGCIPHRSRGGNGKGRGVPPRSNEYVINPLMANQDDKVSNL